jgi:hypothetical protein
VESGNGADALERQPDVLSQLVQVFAPAHALVAYTHAVDYANGWGVNLERSLQTSLEIAGRNPSTRQRKANISA